MTEEFSKRIENIFKILGIVWSIAAFIAAAAFFFGGEWRNWSDVKKAVLGDPPSVVSEIESKTADALDRIERATLANTGSPPGAIAAFGGSLTSETADHLKKQGWLVCDGAAVSRTEFPELFAAIGTSWGDPGPTTFNLPDLRGLFLRGVDGGSGRDPGRDDRIPMGTNAGPEVGSLQSDSTRLPHTPMTVSTEGAHDHSYTDPLIDDGRACKGHECGGGTASEFPRPSGGSTSSAGGHVHQISGGDAETRPQNASVHYIIRFGQPSNELE